MCDASRCKSFTSGAFYSLIKSLLCAVLIFNTYIKYIIYRKNITTYIIIVNNKYIRYVDTSVIIISVGCCLNNDVPV